MKTGKQSGLIERIILENENKSFQLNSLVLHEIKALKALSNETAWLIFSELVKKENYPLGISKKFKLPEQLTYYYFRKLFNAGLIEISRTEERKGAVAKYYKAKINAITLMPVELKENKNLESIETTKKRLNEPLILKEFIKNNEFNALIVVGSPEVHGKFNARAKDNFLAIELAAFIGLHAGKIKMPLVKLDTYVKDLKELNSDLIVVGGPLTNKIAMQLNEFLSIRFEPKGAHWVIKSTNSGKEFEEETIGLIELIEHPFFKGKHILFIAGKTLKGTKSAVLSILKHSKKLGKENRFNTEKTAHVVEGLDLDADSIIDETRIIE